jgi:carbon-monoxide dehydrogenase catalytic subunit
MCEKAVAIGTYFAASGAHVIFGVGSPVRASSEVTRLMTTGWEELVGGSLEFEPDWEKMLARSLELIDGKRAALKLPAYDPSQFGADGTHSLTHDHDHDHATPAAHVDATEA